MGGKGPGAAAAAGRGLWAAGPAPELREPGYTAEEAGVSSEGWACKPHTGVHTAEEARRALWGPTAPRMGQAPAGMTEHRSWRNPGALGPGGGRERTSQTPGLGGRAGIPKQLNVQGWQRQGPRDFLGPTLSPSCVSTGLPRDSHASRPGWAEAQPSREQSAVEIPLPRQEAVCQARR